MTPPLRRALLNEHINAWARQIAHAWTTTCHGEHLSSDDEWHTNRCNRLKADIVQLAMSVKLAREQRPVEPEPAPEFEMEGPPDDPLDLRGAPENA